MMTFLFAEKGASVDFGRRQGIYRIGLICKYYEQMTKEIGLQANEKTEGAYAKLDNAFWELIVAEAKALDK